MNATKLHPKSPVSIIATVMTLSLVCAAEPADGRRALSGHVPPAVAKLNLQPIDRLPASNRLRLAIGLPLRNTNEMERLLQDIYNPSSPKFRQYLTVEEFTERFGPAPEDYEAVKRFAIRQGLDVAETYPNRVILDVTGPVSRIEEAFRVKLNLYGHPDERRSFYAPEAEPSVEVGLAILDVSGLNNFSAPRAALRRGAPFTAPRAAAGSGPGGYLLGNDYRNAYVPGVALTGTGQMVGLVEFASYIPSDVADYEDVAGLPHVPLYHVLLDGFDGQPSGGVAEVEANVDIDMAVAMAPGLAGVVIFDAGGSGILNDVLSRMAASNHVRQLSSSWSGNSPPYQTSDNLFKQMALQGQSFFVAAGDADAQSQYWTPLQQYAWPCDDPTSPLSAELH
jgi:subtilase family serine protease